MAQTVISKGDALARKIFSVGLMAEQVRRGTFRSKLTGPMTGQPAAMAKMRMRSKQTSMDMPIVQITDLQKGAGDTVSVDFFGLLSGYPIMGDEKLSGKGQALKTSSIDISVNQYRQASDPGGKMTQQRTVWDLRQVSLANLAPWFARCEDQLCLVHLAGARGFDDAVDWCLPLDSDPRFNTIVVNPVLPPTANRRFFAGDATSASNIDVADALTLEDIDKLRASLDEMVLPPSAVKIPGDMAAQDDPLYLMYVTSRQWHYLETTSGRNGVNWRTFLSNATKRMAMNKHPLFLGETGIWNGILVRKTNPCDSVPDWQCRQRVQPGWRAGRCQCQCRRIH